MLSSFTQIINIYSRLAGRGRGGLKIPPLYTRTCPGVLSLLGPNELLKVKLDFDEIQV
jgi:hypothetical protein